MASVSLKIKNVTFLLSFETFLLDTSPAEAVTLYLKPDVMAGIHPTARELRFYKEAVKVVEEHIANKDFNVTELSVLLGMSRVTLHRKIKTILDKPAGIFIRELRLDHAAELLRQGEMNVSEAAEHSGFYNHSYFSKCFRERFGCLPSQFQFPNTNIIKP